MITYIIIYYMTQIHPKKYFLQEINEISKNRFVCHISQETIDIINEIATKVGSPQYIKTPVFNKRIQKPFLSTKIKPLSSSSSSSSFKKKNKVTTEIFNNEDWEAIHSFETTKSTVVKIDSPLVNIRKIMNMVAQNNYLDKQNEIKNILDAEENDLPSLIQIIFEIASENKFYSEIYCKIYTNLSREYPQMLTIVTEHIIIYLDSFRNMVSENINDYDELCKMNKQNDKVKAFSSFIKNLTTMNTLDSIHIIHILDVLFQELLGSIKKENEKKKVDEIIENIAILYNEFLFSEHRCNSYFGDLSYQALIQELSNLKVKQYPSITSKSIFKCKDIIEHR